MDEKSDKKKESIDEILSDLNGLLNKMPSILDGIRMPEMRPQEPPPAAEPPAPEQRNEIPPSIEDADKTVVLDAFSGLSEGSSAPEATPAREPQAFETPGERSYPEAGEQAVPEPSEVPLTGDAEPAEIEQPRDGAPIPEAGIQAMPEAYLEADADKVVAPDVFSGLNEGGPVSLPTEPGAPRELSAEPPLEAPAKLSGLTFEPPAENLAQPGSKAPSLNISESTPLQDEGEKQAEFSAAAQPEASLRGVEKNIPEQAGLTPEPSPAQPGKQAALPAYDNTRDFGIPDIDALIQLSESAAPAPEPQQEAVPPEAGAMPGSVQAIEAEQGGPSIQGLEPVSPQEPEAEGVIMENNEPKDEKNEIPRTGTEEPSPEAGTPPADAEARFPEASVDAAAAPAPATDNLFDAFAIVPPAPESAGDLPQEPAAREQPSAGENAGPDFETPAGAVSDAAQEPRFGSIPELSAELPPEQPAPAPEAAETLSLEPAAREPVQEPAAEPAAASEAPQPGGIELSPGLELGAPPRFGAEGQAIPAPDAALDGADETIPGGAGLELGGASGDETLAISPSEVPSGEEEKTVIFQASPVTTSRAQAADLFALAVKDVPEGIPQERVRSLVFIYSPEDKALCATVLAELDSICLKSATKPMFIKRASVKECEPDANANFLHQSVAESGAQGMVCVGSVPQDKVYELENAFSNSGGFFRYYDASTFSHSAALDLVTDLILR